MSLAIIYKVYSRTKQSNSCLMESDADCLGAFHPDKNPQGCQIWNQCGNYEYLGKLRVGGKRPAFIPAKEK